MVGGHVSWKTAKPDASHLVILLTDAGWFAVARRELGGLGVLQMEGGVVETRLVVERSPLSDIQRISGLDDVGKAARQALLATRYRAAGLGASRDGSSAAAGSAASRQPVRARSTTACTIGGRAHRCHHQPGPLADCRIGAFGATNLDASLLCLLKETTERERQREREETQYFPVLVFIRSYLAHTRARSVTSPPGLRAAAAAARGGAPRSAAAAAAAAAAVAAATAAAAAVASPAAAQAPPRGAGERRPRRPRRLRAP